MQYLDKGRGTCVSGALLIMRRLQPAKFISRKWYSTNRKKLLSFAAFMLYVFCAKYSFSQAVPASQNRGGLVLQNLQVPLGARFVGLEVHISGGAFEGVSNMPMGWKTTVDDDPTWRADFETHSQSGAASIDEAAVEKIGLQIVKTEIGGTRFDIWGAYIMESAEGKEKRVPLDSFSFEFVERYPRHRLYNSP